MCFDLTVCDLKLHFTAICLGKIDHKRSGTVVSLGKRSQKPLGLNLSLWSLHVLFVFLPQSKDTQVGLIGDSALPVGVNVNGCLSPCVSPVTNWRHVHQTLPRRPPRTLQSGC